MGDVKKSESAKDGQSSDGSSPETQPPDLARFSPELIMSLQGTIGNQAVLQLLRQNTAESSAPEKTPFSFLRSGRPRSVQRTGEALSAATATLRHEGGGTVKNKENSTFKLDIGAPPTGKYYYFRWSARDADNNAYFMRSTHSDEVVQNWGTSQSAYLNQPSLQMMFNRDVVLGCRVLCRVIETDSPTIPDRYAYGNTQVFSVDFNFNPDPKEYKRIPKDVTVLAWTGEIDNTTWAAGATDLGEIEVTSLETLASSVEAALPSDRYYVRQLLIKGHGSSGAMSPNITSAEINGASRGALLKMRELLGADSSVYLYGCEVAQGPVGRHLIQQMSDLLNVPVKANTSYVHLNEEFELGILETAHPGDQLGSDAEIIADQIYRTLNETTVTTARIILKQLEDAAANHLLDDVVQACRDQGHWKKIRGQLEAWHTEYISLKWFSETYTVRERIEKLGILKYPLDAPPPGRNIKPD